VIEVTVITVKEVSDGLTGTVKLSIGVPGESLLSVNKVSNIGDLPVTPNVGKSMYSTATLIWNRSALTIGVKASATTTPPPLPKTGAAPVRTGGWRNKGPTGIVFSSVITPARAALEAPRTTINAFVILEYMMFPPT
jgi:hypothetical protein